MALTGIKFCKPTAVDTKKQNSRPIFQPLRMLSSVSNTMHQTNHHDFPFVPLTGHKEVDEPRIPTSFDIMGDDHTNFGEDFGFVKGNNFTNARAIFKNASFKGCHQFPMISISQLVGGFVGSKSQVHAKNRESHQIWDIVFQKLDEFVNSRPVERYTEHCYEFQTLSQNFIGSLYKKGTSSPLGLAASYILADSGQSFKHSKPTSNITKSSPTTQSPVEIIPPPVNTFVSHSPVPASHSPSNPSTVPVILNLVEHLISQSDLSSSDAVTSEPLKFACVDPTVPTSSTHESLGGRHSNEDPDLEDTSVVPSEAKQSYAEVAKMAHGRSATDGDRRSKTSSRRSRRVCDRYFVRNDSRQRRVDSSNWREQAGPSECRDLRRDRFTPRRTIHAWKSEPDSKSVPKEISPSHRRRKTEGSKYTKPCIALKTVPEGSTKESANKTKPSPPENSCQFYNPNKRSCTNWRCRQHCQKSSAKRNMRFVLVDNTGDDDRTQNVCASQSPDKSDIRINTLECYITTPRSGSRPDVQCLPSVEDTRLDVPTRERSLSDSTECRVVSQRNAKERSSSESSDGTRSVPRSRSVSEDSSPSLSSVASSGSLGAIAECDVRRRFSSECDSEDSFVIFDGGDSSDDGDSVTSAGDSEWGEWESDSDEPDSECPRVSLVLCVPARAYDDYEKAAQARLREANARWGVQHRGTSPKERPSATPGKKVQFACGRSLSTVHPMVAWGHAYRAARCGPWEEMARDRERFRQRVDRSEAVLSAVLGSTHRDAVFGRIAAAGRHDLSVPTSR